MERSKIVISCQPSLAPVLEKEVKSLGYKILNTEKSGVTVEGGWEEVMDLNLNLRTASRVLWLIKSFEAAHPDELYIQAKKIPWHEIIPGKGFISIQSFVKNDYILDVRFANLKLKDAIVDKMQDENGFRPDSGKERDRTVLYLYWQLNKVYVYVDTSGETIAKHGYRKLPFKAPMIEALASACLISADWSDSKESFINPMCGSGTLAIEAAMMAANIPPGLRRRNFGFMHVVGYDNSLWRVAIEKAREKIKETIESTIIATDWNGDAIAAARENARVAGVEEMITFEKVPFEETAIPSGDGVVMLNPEYGERLGEEEELKEVYKGIGDFFKQSCKGKMGYIFTGNMSLAKSIGLRPKRRLEFLNAKIDCRLLEYEMYDGSKKEDRKHRSEEDLELRKKKNEEQKLILEEAKAIALLEAAEKARLQLEETTEVEEESKPRYSRAVKSEVEEDGESISNEDVTAVNEGVAEPSSQLDEAPKVREVSKPRYSKAVKPEIEEASEPITDEDVAPVIEEDIESKVEENSENKSHEAVNPEVDSVPVGNEDSAVEHEEEVKPKPKVDFKSRYKKG
ncbi:MAG: hypothetical protein OCD76_20765 [Reichenbachiella sp.]